MCQVDERFIGWVAKMALLINIIDLLAFSIASSLGLTGVYTLEYDATNRMCSLYLARMHHA